MKEGDITPQQITEILDQLFSRCNIVVAEIKSVLKSKGELTGLSKEIASFAMENDTSGDLQSKKITGASVKNWIEMFLGANQTAVVIDTTNELGLYEEGAEKLNLKQKEEEKDEFKEQLVNNIALYEKLLAQQKAQGKNTTQTAVLIDSLKGQLKVYMSQNPNAEDKAANNQSMSIYGVIKPKKALTQQEKKTKALKDIFHFYAKQRVHVNGKKTFDAVNEEEGQLVLGYFIKMLKDFSIPNDPKVFYFRKTMFYRK